MEAAASWMLEAGGTKRSADEIAKQTTEEAKRRQGGSGSRRENGEERDLLKELVKVLAALSIANARDMRELTGTIFHCFIFPEQHGLVKAMVETGKKYHEKIKDNKKNHNEGPPFLHVWVAVINYLAKDQEGKLKESDKQILVQYWNEAVKKPREDLELEIKHCRAKPTYDKKFYKISFAVACTGGDFEKALLSSMETLGGIKKIGPPPAGHLEREAQRLLERMQ
jgi:hypothetical protein